MIWIKDQPCRRSRVRKQADGFKLFGWARPPPLLGLRRKANIVELYGAIYDALLPRHLADQFKSLDTSHEIRVTLRTGQTFWFPRNTAVSVIVARIVEETR